ncbi:MAG TPA: phosphoribosylamine--glycine ligase [Candidatus Paceibacterota bacterium]|nr:phosphoribosylamine--glycine ligase [Candidatus Paceibacterota bacterium]
MNILVLGSGGREHALSWKIAQSPLVQKLYIAPGNAGTAQVGENVALTITDTSAVAAFCKEQNIGLVVVGPDDLLAVGIVDALETEGITVFGPSKAAAQIEWSKAYAKQVMQEEGIPTARHRVFESAEGALAYAEKQPLPLVIKADGLALGKGVVIATTHEEAAAAINDFMGKKIHGDAGATVVIEEYMEGLEISVHALCDGERALMFPSSKDHKRVRENDEGPNTGGMGTVAPVPIVPAAQMQLVEERIVLPLLAALKKRGTPFKGLLFPGVMLTKYGPMVIEFNARFGDPETQSYMRLMESDVVPVLFAAAKGDIGDIRLTWEEGAAACIVMASGGYPGAYEKGKEIAGIENAEANDCVVFHAGTKRDEDGTLRTNGGRVLNVTALGKELPEALHRAYEGVATIQFEGAQHRTDLGKKAIP